jgi:murein DD-endopeptidase MepM/ murein hydrolase activator NlpD
MAGFKSLDWLRKLLPVKAKPAAETSASPTNTKNPKSNKGTQVPVSSSHTYNPNKSAKKQAAPGKSEVILTPSATPGDKPTLAVNIRSKKTQSGSRPASGGSRQVSGKQGPLLAPEVKTPIGKNAKAKQKQADPAAIAASIVPVFEAPVDTTLSVAEAPDSTTTAAVTELNELPAANPSETSSLPQAEHISTAAPVAKRSLLPLPLLLSKRPGDVRLRRVLQASAAGGAVVLAVVITLGGHKYVEANTLEVYHVFMNGNEVGVVSNPQVVDDFKINKYRKLAQLYPQTQMVLNTDSITITAEKAFKAEADDEAALSTLSTMLTSHAVGAELFVNGKSMGILHSEEEANQLLEKMKEPYVTEKAKKQLKVATLSVNSAGPAAPSLPPAGQSALEELEFVEKVEIKPVSVEPDAFVDPDALLETLRTGDVREKNYTIVQGDVLGTIAEQFDLSVEDIRKMNPEIKGDFIREGQVLNLTVLQPAITVRTVELVTETEVIQHGKEVIRDAEMKDGVVKKVSAGKNGSKRVTFEVTKLNGEVETEKLVKEQILLEPVKEVVRRGTKVIRGEGTGNFSWPVVSSTLTSGYGSRWGRMHKGLDLISSNKNILAADNGVVIKSGFRYDYGNYVIIDHNNGYETLYGHMSRINVSNGQTVEKGEKIGYMGNSGDSTGVHLHFEIHLNGNIQNPLKYLNR